MSQELATIQKRRLELRQEFAQLGHDYFFDNELIAKLIETEDKLSKINAFAQAIATEKEKMRLASDGMAWRIASDTANSLEKNLVALVLGWIES